AALARAHTAGLGPHRGRSKLSRKPPRSWTRRSRVMLRLAGRTTKGSPTH
ncbi:hypothetical protein TGAM01_v210881, partial [Trichoderma gamsii]